MSQTYVSKALRERVAAQATYRCGYCLTQEAVAGFSLEIEHLIPEVLGGPTEEDNLWLACSACNDAKEVGFPPSIRLPERPSDSSIHVTKRGRTTSSGRMKGTSSWA